jgi:hypothetical protein
MALPYPACAVALALAESQRAQRNGDAFLTMALFRFPNRYADSGTVTIVFRSENCSNFYF